VQFSSRRRAPRLAVHNQIRAEIVGLGSPVDILDISFGGVSLRTQLPIVRDTRHVLLISGATVCVKVTARIAHCRPAVNGSGRPCYIVGCEFSNSARSEHAVMRLIDAVAAEPSLDTVS